MIELTKWHADVFSFLFFFFFFSSTVCPDGNFGNSTHRYVSKNTSSTQKLRDSRLLCNPLLIRIYLCYKGKPVFLKQILHSLHKERNGSHKYIFLGKTPVWVIQSFQPFYKTAHSKCCPDLSIGSKLNSGKKNS